MAFFDPPGMDGPRGRIANHTIHGGGKRGEKKGEEKGDTNDPAAAAAAAFDRSGELGVAAASAAADVLLPFR